MISICLTKFVNKPWDNMIMNAFKKALTEESHFAVLKKYKDILKKI